MQTKEKNLNSDKLWDEILKSIVQNMPAQLLPLIKDVFGIEYSKDVNITLLPTEQTLPQDGNYQKLTSIYSDIALMIDGKDIYHIESQMKNTDNMSIRMIKYDFHLALSNSTTKADGKSFTIEFPKSVVIYPAVNNSIPDELTCHLIFPDGSTHDYKVPTVKIQTYSFQEIREKHLTLFLPFKLLQFVPRLKSSKSPLTANELTKCVDDIIFILKEEKDAGRITQAQYEDYIDLIDKSAERVFAKHQNFQEQVINMTKSLITLPSERYAMYEKQIAEKDSAIATITAEKDAAIANITAEKDTAIALTAKKDAEIAELKKQIEQLKSNN